VIGYKIWFAIIGRNEFRLPAIIAVGRTREDVIEAGNAIAPKRYAIQSVDFANGEIDNFKIDQQKGWIPIGE
jgi:hypothetical protein